MGAMTVTVLIFIVLGDRCAPESPTLEVDVLNIRSRVNDIDIHAFSTFSTIKIFSKGPKSQFVSVGNPGQAPRRARLEFTLGCGVDLRVFLDEVDLFTEYIGQHICFEVI